ncbi:rhomboid family intramembrane serine protease [Sphingobacterium paludis]|uniref:Membrane associated rhomboid family serine protease n=1 Tax=Sphingobacterium paludis TaxID=1476465 RepID=A0A4R7CSZ0_9SPHI|nr:rhomboid family intramembrane serine protease [Sphingobacterium paludis]TDS10382.1 membrane associated rhomboid family serine protease [Sphingobacterium paludis]
MKESVLKAFWRDTYQSRSPIPFIISVQVLVFVLIHLFELLVDLNVVQFSLEEWISTHLTLPLSPTRFIQQPWTIVTYSFIYKGLFQLLFDCLWLYWIGNTFLNFLTTRQFLFLYSSAVLVGGMLYPLFGLIPAFHTNTPLSFYGASFALGSIVAAIATLVPKSEIRLLLFGNVSFKNLAIVFITLSAILIGMVNKAGAVTFLCTSFWGLFFVRALQQGNDFSLFFQFKKRSKLKVVHSKGIRSAHTYRHQSDLPNQEEVDEILDKISISGYDSLTSQEKEVLFKASNDER